MSFMHFNTLAIESPYKRLFGKLRSEFACEHWAISQKKKYQFIDIFFKRT